MKLLLEVDKQYHTILYYFK